MRRSGNTEAQKLPKTDWFRVALYVFMMVIG